MKVLRKSVVGLICLFLAVGASCAQIVEECYDKGIRYAAQGRFNEAEKEFKKALEIDQFYIPAKECLKVIEDVLEKKIKKEALSIYLKGCFITLRGCLIRKLQSIRKLLLLIPILRKEMFDKAIIEYKKAIAINPNFAEVYNNLGIAYSKKGMFDEAITEFKKAIAINPNDAVVYYNLAVAYYGKKEYDLAVEYCDKVIELGYEVNPVFLKLLKSYRK